MIDKQLRLYKELGLKKVVKDENGIEKHYLVAANGPTFSLAYHYADLNEEVEALDLQDQLFDTIPSEIFNYPNLKVLILGKQVGSRKNIDTIPPQIGQLQQLEYLHLKGCAITSLPPEIGMLANLKYLNLRSTNLQTFPPEISQLSNLLQLDASYLKLPVFPPEILSLSNLTHLYLGVNNIAEIPSEIGKLSNLIYLDLICNQLQVIPPEIRDLQQLQYLYLRTNKLQELPEELFQLTNLVHLYLGTGRWDSLVSDNFNQLKVLPPEIGNLTKLEILQWSYNELENIPIEINKLTNLKQFYLDGVGLERFPTNIFTLTNLEQLGLTYNDLDYIPRDIAHLSKLQYLYLRWNPLPDREARKVQKILPNCTVDLPTNLDKGFMLYENENYEEAIPYLKKTIELKEDEGFIDRCYLYLAVCYTFTEPIQADLALACLEGLFAEYKEEEMYDPDMLMEIAYIYAETGHPEEAEDFAEQARLLSKKLDDE